MSKKIILVFTILLLLVSLQLAANSIQYQKRGDQKFAPDRILVKLTNLVIDQVSINNKKQINIQTIDQLNEQHHVKSVKKAYIDVNNKQMEEQLGISRWFIIKFENPIDIEYLVSQLRELPEIEEATPDYLAFPTVSPNDPMYSSQWGHNNTSQMLSWSWSTSSHTGSPVGTVGFDTNAETGWNWSQGYGSSSVIIAIIDSGVDAGHADLNQVTGYDFGDNDNNPDDNSASPGHGTACSGIAAGIANNNLGVAGIAGGCSIMPLKVADSAGAMYFSAVDNALYYAANNGADIASLSLGASINPSVLPNTEAALQYALSAGVIIFAATANANNSSIDYPANSQYAISVGAASPDDGRKRSSSNPAHVNPGNYTDPNGVTIDNEVWWGSNYGSTTQDARDAVDIIAPTILPTTDISGSGGYSSTDYSMWFNGTSCSTPYAAGVAALIKSKNPSWTPAQIRTQLINTAIDIVNVESATGWDRYSGYGMVDAGSALYDPQIILTAPNGGENWVLGTSHNITWTSQDITNIAIDLYDLGTYVYTIIGSYTASSGSMTWPIPTGLTASSNYSIRISDASSSTTYDYSNAYFTLYNLPSDPTDISVTNGSITQTDIGLEWTGASPEFRVVRTTGGPASTPTSGTLVYEGTAISATATSLTANSTYFFTVYGKSSGSSTYSNGNQYLCAVTEATSGTTTATVPTGQTGEFTFGTTGSVIDININSDPDGGSLGSEKFTSSPSGDNSISGSATAPDASTVTPNIFSSEQYWTINSTLTGTNNFTVYFDISGLSGVNNPDKLLILKRDSGGWIAQNTLRNGNQLYTDIISFSDFIIGADSGDNPLPVNLSSFTVAYISGSPVINWVTQSETDNIGWNIYRAYSYNFGQAYMLNLQIIPGNGTTSQPSFYSYTDEYEVFEGFTYWYWLESISGSGETETYGPISLTIPSEENEIPEIPMVTELYQNFPNPFNPSTLISFDIKEDEKGIISIYNVKGQLIVTDDFEAGRHYYAWDARNQASGVYLYKLQTESYSKIMRMLLVK